MVQEHFKDNLMSLKYTFTLSLWYQITSGGGLGLNLDTQVRLIVEPLSTCMSGPPRTSVTGSEKQKFDDAKLVGIKETPGGEKIGYLTTCLCI